MEKELNKAYAFGKNRGVKAYYNEQLCTVELPEAVFEYILSLVPTEEKWIPVSERLPEEFESVLVCYKSQGGMAQAVSERFGTHTGYRWSALAGIKPIAWMPLPKPYETKAQ